MFRSYQYQIWRDKETDTPDEKDFKAFRYCIRRGRENTILIGKVFQWLRYKKRTTINDYDTDKFFR